MTYRGEHLYVIDKIAERAGTTGGNGDTRRAAGRASTSGGDGPRGVGGGIRRRGGTFAVPEFGYASPESAERARAGAGTGKRRTLRSPIRTPTNDEDDSVPASNLADRRSVSVPRDRSADPGARGDAWSLFDEDPALASAPG